MGEGNGHELMGPILVHLRYQRFRLSTTSGCRRDHCGLKASTAWSRIRRSASLGSRCRRVARKARSAGANRAFSPCSCRSRTVIRWRRRGSRHLAGSEDHRVGGEDRRHRAYRRHHNRRINDVRGPSGILVTASKRPIWRGGISASTSPHRPPIMKLPLVNGRSRDDPRGARVAAGALA